MIYCIQSIDSRNFIERPLIPVTHLYSWRMLLEIHIRDNVDKFQLKVMVKRSLRISFNLEFFFKRNAKFIEEISPRYKLN